MKLAISLIILLWACALAKAQNNGTYGSTFPLSGNAIGFTDGTNFQPGKVDGSRNLYVNCAVGCSASAGFADNSSFTVGATAINVIGGYYTSGAAPSLSSGNAARARIDANSYLFVDCVVGCSGGSTTPADAFANPSTAGLQFDLLAAFNGSTWDRLRTAGIGNTVAATGIGVQSPYCEFLTVLPTLTNATYGAAQCDSSSRLFVNVSNSTLAVTQSTSPWVVSCTAANCATNVAQFGGTNVVTGTGASGSGIPRVTISNDSSLAANQSVNVNQVAGAATSATNPLYVGIADGTNGAAAVKAASTQAAAADKSLVVQINPNQPNLTTALNVSLAANQSVNVAQIAGNSTTTVANGTQAVAPVPSASSTQALLACNILSTASTNSTNCKNAAGNFFGYEVFNTTTTVYYLRIYNSSSAPTCSSSTGFVKSIPIPPAASSGLVGGIVSNQDYAVNYATGISYCITGGSSSTDNTNAAAGVFGEIRYD